MNPTKRERIAALEKKNIELLNQITALWLPIESAPENKPLLVKYARDINELGNVHVHERRGQYWYNGTREGRHLEQPIVWQEVPK